MKPLRADSGSLVSATQSSKFFLHIIPSYSFSLLEEVCAKRLIMLADLTIVPVFGTYCPI